MTYSSKLKHKPSKARASYASGSSGRASRAPTGRSGGRSLVLVALLILLVAAVGWQWFQSRGAALEDTATLTVQAGTAMVTRSGGSAESVLAAGQSIRMGRGDALATTAETSAKLTLSGGETIELAGKTRVSVLELYRAPTTRALVAVLALHQGKTLCRVRHGILEGMRFEIEMNTAVVKARGTVFQCDALANDHAYVLVYDGAVEVSMGEQLANLQAGQALDIWLGQPLEPVDTGRAIPGGPPESTALPVSTPTFTEREKTAFPPVSTPTRPGDLIATPEGGLVYTVESGDTLYSIARKFDVSWEAIWNANKDILPRPEFVKAGQQLRIPAR